MKVALIQCPGWGRDCPPYSMALLSAILRKAGHQSFCFDLNNSLYFTGSEEYHKFWDDKDLYTFWSSKNLTDKFIQDNKKMIELQVEQILNTGARIIGFTVHFSSLLVSLEIAKRIKDKDKKRIIVFGGPDCCRQLRGLELIKEESVDIVNVGEGDRSILELVNILESKDEVEFLKGALIKKNGKFIDCGDIEVVEDLNTLPFPDYSDFTDDILSGLYRQPERLEIFDSRGCIVKCHFCSEWQFWKRFRTMSGERMFAEVSFQIKKYPQIDYFYFIGSLLNGSIKALSDFCDLLIKNGLKIRWLGQAIIRKEMTKEFLQKMRRAGCQWLGYGIESGSQGIVNKMNKRFSLKLAEQVLRDTYDVGIEVQANFMFGMPTETEEDFRETLNFLKRNRDSINSILASQSFCVIDKDTYLYNHAEEFNITDREHHLYWEGDGNTYPERLRRYEEFCKLALTLGIPQTSGVLRVKPDKWRLLGEYHLYKKEYLKAIDCFQKTLETESQEDSILDKINRCQKELERNNHGHISTHDLTISQSDLFEYSNNNFEEKQKRIFAALNRLNLKEKLENFILIEKEKKERQEFVTAYPYWLTIDAINFCNLKCPFCPTGQGRNSRHKAILSLDNFKKIINELGPYLIHVDFCNWGEPLLNKQIYEMIKITKQYQIDTKIDTNLNKISQSEAEELILSGLDRLIVSIDGATPDTYSKYRIGGDFNRVIENLKMLIRIKRNLNRTTPHICWQFLVFRHNEHEIEDVKRIGNDLGVDHVGITKAFIGDKDWIPLNEEYSYYKREEIDNEYTSEHFKDAKEKMCNWPWEAIVINPNGSVSPCCSAEDEKDDFANIFTQPFKEIWNNEKYKTARKYIKDKKKVSFKDKNICINCRHLGMINLDILSCHSFFTSKKE